MHREVAFFLFAFGVFILEVYMLHATLGHKHFTSKMASKCWNALQFVGLKTFGVPSVNKSLLFGGKYSFQYDGPPIFGQIDLFVGHRQRVSNTRPSHEDQSGEEQNVL